MLHKLAISPQWRTCTHKLQAFEFPSALTSKLRSVSDPELPIGSLPRSPLRVLELAMDYMDCLDPLGLDDEVNPLAGDLLDQLDFLRVHIPKKKAKIMPVSIT